LRFTAASYVVHYTLLAAGSPALFVTLWVQPLACRCRAPGREQALGSTAPRARGLRVILPPEAGEHAKEDEEGAVEGPAQSERLTLGGRGARTSDEAGEGP
jgi:hypothetical protein